MVSDRNFTLITGGGKLQLSSGFTSEDTEIRRGQVEWGRLRRARGERMEETSGCFEKILAQFNMSA